MATNYPSDIDILQNPLTTDSVKTVSHASQHGNANDAIEALEAKVGIDSSAVQSSHDFKLGEITGADKGVGKSALQTLTNKTLTTPKIETSINDSNGNEVIKTPATGSAVNEVTIINAKTGSAVEVNATGDDTNIPFEIKAKGTGKVKLGTAKLQIPNVDGTINQVVKTDGAGTLGWVSPSSTPTVLTLVPNPVAILSMTTQTLAANTVNNNTKMRLGQIVVSGEITVNKITIAVAGEIVEGQLRIGIYSEDGQTKFIDVLTDTIITPNTNVITVVNPAVLLSPGIYYVALLSVGTMDYNTMFYSTFNSGVTNFTTLADEPVLEGWGSASSAGTLEATFNPSTFITPDILSTLALRLDN